MRALLFTSAAALIALGPTVVSAARPQVSAAKPGSRPKTQKSSTPQPKAGAATTKAKTKANANAKATSRRATVPRAKARAKAAKRHKSTDGSAALATLLRRYVDGKSSRKIDRKIAAGMKTRGASKVATARILARVDAASPGQRKRTFGKASTRAPATTRSLEEVVAPVASHNPTGTVMSLRPAVTLPPQGVPKPTSFSLVKTGVVTLETEDSDGADELIMLAVVARADGNDFLLDTRALGSETDAARGVKASSDVVYAGAETDALIITAVIEDDDGNGVAAQEEIELLLNLAASVAATMPGDDRIAVLKTMVDYTIALDGVGSDASRAARSVVATPCLKADWFPLWSVPASTTDPADWKLAIPHAAGSGRYELLLNVPGTAPEMTTVRATVSDFELDVEVPEDYVLDWARVTVGIGDETTSFGAENGAPLRPQPVERMVLGGDVDIRVSGRLVLRYPALAEMARCDRKRSASGRRRCRLNVVDLRKSKRREHEIDFAAGSATEFRSTFSTVLGGFKKAVNTKKPAAPGSTAPTSPASVIRKKTAQGSDKPTGKAAVSARVR